MSLYRLYRPQTFADVIGQDHIVTTLERAAEQEQLAHAYLFAGSRGTGKTSVARILAKVLMTRNIADEKIRKQIEKGVEEGNMVDLLEIDAASNRGIDDIRDLIEKIQFSPVVATSKVYIIDEVHMLTKEAFNALLKTLEEPPPYAFFILATTELNKIPVTIQSRCQCFPFRHIREEDIIRRLQYIADSEKITIERDALRVIARHVDGGMRDAISLLDQLRSLPKITKEDVEDRAGSPGHEYVERVLQAIHALDTQAILDAVHALEDNGIPTDVFLRQLLGDVREQLHAAIEAKQSTDALIHTIDTLLQAIRDARSSPLPHLTLEAALLSLARGSDAAPAPRPAPEVRQEPKPAAQPVPTPRKQEEAVVVEAPVAPPVAAEIEAPEISLESIRQQWPSIVKSTEPASVRMSLKDGRVHALDGTTVIVAFGSAFHRDKVSATDASRTVEETMERIFRRSLRLQCTIGDRATAVPAQDAVNLAEAAAEIF
jgi:DNA polymerase-3 subunit gamma/tau